MKDKPLFETTKEDGGNGELPKQYTCYKCAAFSMLNMSWVFNRNFDRDNQDNSIWKFQVQTIQIVKIFFANVHTST